jgi:hypothetical protein
MCKMRRNQRPHHFRQLPASIEMGDLIEMVLAKIVLNKLDLTVRILWRHGHRALNRLTRRS